MKNKLRLITNHSVSKNGIALIIQQVSNALIPLLIIPFLTRALGIETFGKVAITLAVIQLAYVVTDYGFSLSAPFSISQIREDKKTVSELIGAIFILKLGFACLASTCVVLYGLISSSTQMENLLYLIAPVAIFGQAFQPFWFFQGIEKMKNVTIYMVISRCLYAVFILLSVSVPDDAWLVVLSWGMANVIGSLFAVWLVYAEGYKIILPCQSKLLSVFKESSHFFISRVAVSLYTSASTVVVGLVGGVVPAAQFSVCELLYKGGQSVTAPISQAMYPYMAKERDWTLFYKIVVIVGSIIALGCFVLSFFSDDILAFVFGEEYRDAAIVLVIFLVANVVNYFSVIFGYPAHAATGDVSFANSSVILGSVLHILFLSTLFMLNEISALSVAVAVLFTEITVMSLRVWHIKNRNNY